MGYKLTRKDFGNDPLLDTLIALKKTLAELGLELYIVGAGARDICMNTHMMKLSLKTTLLVFK